MRVPPQQLNHVVAQRYSGNFRPVDGILSVLLCQLTNIRLFYSFLLLSSIFITPVILFVKDIASRLLRCGEDVDNTPHFLCACSSGETSAFGELPAYPIAIPLGKIWSVDEKLLSNSLKGLFSDIW